MAAQKGVMKRDVSVTTRTFSYHQGGVRLDFNLRIDIKQDLKDYVDLLSTALDDVRTELNNLKK